MMGFSKIQDMPESKGWQMDLATVAVEQKVMATKFHQLADAIRAHGCIQCLLEKGGGPTSDADSTSPLTSASGDCHLEYHIKVCFGKGMSIVQGETCAPGLPCKTSAITTNATTTNAITLEPNNTAVNHMTSIIQEAMMKVKDFAIKHICGDFFCNVLYLIGNIRSILSSLTNYLVKRLPQDVEDLGLELTDSLQDHINLLEDVEVHLNAMQHAAKAIQAQIKKCSHGSN